MKILLLNPPFLPSFSRSSRSPAVTKGGTIYYPMWLAYATGVLEKAGQEAKLIDAPADKKTIEDVLEIVQEFKPEMVVLDTSTPSIYSDIRVLEKIKEKNNCFGVLVGTHVSALPEETLKISKKIDAIARHEYDYTLRELAEKLEKGEKIDSVKGISLQKKGRIIHNPDRELIQNLDEIPFVSEVYKKHLNYKNYFYSANLWPEITIVTGRGCPHRCTFCVLPQVMNGRVYRKRSVENVVKEFKYIKENFPDVKEIFIEDDTLPADRLRTRELCDALVKENVRMTWSCNARADVDLETLKRMKKAGCRLLCVGFESGVQEILNNIKKGTKIETIKQFMKDTKKAGILVHGCFLLGNEGETKETIKETIEFAKELNPDTAQFFPIMVYPGTEAYENFKKKGFIVSENWRDWLDEEGNHNCMVSRPWLSNKELVAGCDEARRQFYLRPKYVVGKIKQIVTQPKEIPRIFKAGKTFARHLLKKK